MEFASSQILCYFVVDDFTIDLVAKPNYFAAYLSTPKL